MAMRLPLKFLLQLVAALLLLNSANSKGLKVGFYKKTCPNVEAIVQKATYKHISRAPTLAAPLLRMHFHDCFVRGCDGSVLLNGTRAEKTAFPNQSLRGFQVIDAAKEEVEEACPGVVSCADILALVVRDAVSLIEGPHWEVPTGRRDGRVSKTSEVRAGLPTPFSNISALKASFGSKGLSAKDLVVLSGSHTIGTSHCRSFVSRIYNFTGRGDVDPVLDPNYIPKLRSKCTPKDVTTVVEMDPGSFKTFDTDYYKLVWKRRGIFSSDAALLDDIETKIYMQKQLTSPRPSFFKDFGVSMIKMGKIGVLTGKAGEIRKHCAFVNS